MEPLPLTSDAAGPDRVPETIDTSRAHGGRLYDYLVGGKNNYKADRLAAHRAYENYPDGGVAGVRKHAIAQRYFLDRSVRYLAEHAGVRQFLDIGTGLPTENNTHEVAQQVAPESRVVYVDNDPIVLAHARALLTSAPEGRTSYLEADLRDIDRVLRGAEELLDFTKPIAVTMLGVLHFVEDGVAHDRVERLVRVLPEGSYLVVAHLASDVLPEMVDACRSMSQDMTEDVLPRTRAEVARFSEGLDVLDPGVVQVHRWRPEARDLPATDAVPVHAFVARKV
ncbi:SAM-dependent methyltransferase [Saccharopolyspora taberi]|uniref:SAM-dependent methyltransferase n=1 Tax=Saccharopolyspora taberi TaxID=60895 RepID=A0ABN3V9Z2_9PSEU